MSRLPPLPSMRDILNLYRIRALKQLSQNFLMDPRLHNKVVKCAGNLKGCHVIEVGPGPGGLTRAILERGATQCFVIEKDKRFLPTLEMLSEACGGRLQVALGDIMHYDLSSVFPAELKTDWEESRLHRVRIIGNLPFNVATPLIIRWLRDLSSRQGVFTYGRVPLTLTFQKEVAERMVAPPGSPQRCRLSIMCQHLCVVQHKCTIPGKAFLPKPDVDVGVVRFTPLREPLIKLPFDVVEKFMRNIFHFRQKYSIRGVEVLFPKRKAHLAKEVFELSHVDPTTRPFDLTMEELEKMVNVYYALGQKHEGLFQYDYRGPRAFKDEDQFSSGEEDEETGDREVEETGGREEASQLREQLLLHQREVMSDLLPPLIR